MEKNEYHVLVVDDNPKNIQVVANILSSNGYNIEYAMSGKAALQWVEKGKFDLILLDIMMPEMDGFEVCQKLKGNELSKDIPVIFLTAKGGVDTITKGFQLGGVDYIAKPFNSEELLARVKSQVELKRSKEKLSQVNIWLKEQVEEKTGELKRAYEELNKLDKLKTNFLVMLSQEIRAPLNGIVGTINLIKNEEHFTIVKDMVDILEISLSRLENFTSQALLTSQLGSGKFEIHLSELNLKELIQYNLIDLNETIQRKCIEVNTENIQSDIQIKADRELLFKAIHFILDNSVTHSPQNGRITIEATFAGNQTCCSFIDQGKGFSADELIRDYEPFQLDNQNLESKVGLSLYIVKQIMDLHNGNIKLSNKENAGACVSLIFNA